MRTKIKESKIRLEKIKREIIIGDLVLRDNNLSINSLAGLAVEILRTPEVKDYLESLKLKRELPIPSYIG